MLGYKDFETPKPRFPVLCPVCKQRIGSKCPEDPYWSECKECKADFYYGPNEKIPSIARPHSLNKKSQKCNCASCRAREKDIVEEEENNSNLGEWDSYY